MGILKLFKLIVLCKMNEDKLKLSLKQKQNIWIMMKIPSWLYYQWFYDKNHEVKSTLGYLNRSLIKFLYSKNNNNNKKMILTLNQNNTKDNTRLPLKLNIELKINRKHENLKTKECTKRQQFRREIVFETQKKYIPGSKVAVIRNFKNKPDWISGTLKKDLGDEVEVLIDDSKNSEIFIKSNVNILTKENCTKFQTCSVLGLIAIIIQAKPTMNKKYALWLKNKNFKKRIEERIKYVKIRPSKIFGVKQIRQKDEIYLNLILRAFDVKESLSQKEIISLTGET